MAGNFVRTPPQDLATHEVHGTAAVGNEVRSKDDASAVENIGGVGIGQDIIGRAGHDTSGDPVGDGRIDDSAGSAGDEPLGFDRHDVVRCHNARAERAGAITALAVNVGGDNLGAVLDQPVDDVHSHRAQPLDCHAVVAQITDTGSRGAGGECDVHAVGGYRSAASRAAGSLRASEREARGRVHNVHVC